MHGRVRSHLALQASYCTTHPKERLPKDPERGVQVSGISEVTLRGLLKQLNSMLESK